MPSTRATAQCNVRSSSHKRASRTLWGLCSAMAAGLCLSNALAAPLSTDILLNDTPSITTYLGGAGVTVQDISPTHHNRGVFIDGTMISKPTFPWHIAGNPWAQDYYNEKAWWGDSVRLATGTYQVTAVDLELPAPGFTWPIARSYNARQYDFDSMVDDYVTSAGYQGNNWFQMSQPQLVFLDNDSSASTREAEDRLFLIYGADRYIEFLRIDDDEDEFRAINGAAGVIQHDVTASAPDLYTYYDPFGIETVFFGFDDSDGIGTLPVAKEGLLWKISDPDGNVAYVGDETSATTALSSGYDSNGRITTAYDTAERRYTYTYTSGLLSQVKAETKTNPTWASPGTVEEVGLVQYAHYTATSGGNSNKDLKRVTVTRPIADGTLDDVRVTYYRYSDSASLIKYMLEPEGTRNYDWSEIGTGEPEFDEGYESASDAAIESYAAAGFTYDSENRLATAFFNGECGCSGGINGKHTFTYDDSGYYTSTSPVHTTAGYDNFWATRTTVELPIEPNGDDVAYFAYYYDETGQPLGRAIIKGDVDGASTSLPLNYYVAGSSRNTWIGWAERNGDGQIEKLHAHTNNEEYTHSTTTEEPLTLYDSAESDAGLVLHFERIASGGTKGFVFTCRHSKGTIAVGSAYLDDALEYSTRTRSIGSATLTRPLITADWQYQEDEKTTAPGGAAPSGASKLDISTAFFSDTSTNRAYLAAKTETVTWPAVPVLENGSNATDDEIWYFRKDGTTAFHEATDGVFTHWSQDDFGLTDLVVRDAKTNSSDFDASDDALFTDWGITTSGIGLHEDVSYEYDDQGRLTLTTRHPSTGSPGDAPHRLIPTHHHILKDRRPVVLDIPVEDSTPKYFGPVAYTVYNHAGRVEVDATIAIDVTGTTTAPINWINEGVADAITAVDTGTVAHLTSNLYDNAGVRLDEARTFHEIPTSLVSPATTQYDPTTYEYDDRGRLQVETTPKGTVFEYVHDIRGSFVTDQYVGDGGPNSFPTGVKQRATKPSPRLKGPERSVRRQDMMSGKNPVNQGDSYGAAPVDGDSGTEESDGDPTETQCVWIYWALTGGAVALDQDYLGRIVYRANPQAPHLLIKYDNLNRPIAIGLYSGTAGLDPGDDPTTTTGFRVGLIEYEYDARGFNWRTVRHEIDYSAGTKHDSLETLTWVDERGRVLKTDGTSLVKHAYDRLGREMRRFVLAKDDDADYADVEDADLLGDHVLEQHLWGYESHSGNLLLAAVVRRHHGDTSTTGLLDSNADADDLEITASNIDGRADITGFWYDDQDRLIDQVRFGTYGLNESGGPTSFDRGGTANAPSRSDTALRTTYTYNADGETATATDPRDVKATYEYDPMGRLVLQVANDTVASPGAGNDVYTRVTYGKASDTTWEDTVWSDVDGDGTMDVADDQVTTYQYGATATGDGGASTTVGDLLNQVAYPDTSGSSDVVAYEYHINGAVTKVTDQAGVNLEVLLDNAGRQREIRYVEDVLGDTYDEFVDKIIYDYDGLGRLESVKQAGGVTTRDQVEIEYDRWGNVTKIRQDHNSAVGGSQLYDVSFAYETATVGANVLRRTSMTLPNSNVIGYRYNSASGSLDDAASRVSTIHRGGNTDYVEYGYLGLDHVVGIEYPTADIFRRHYGTTSGTYPRLDRFDRVVEDRWTKDLTTDVDFYDQDWSYDRNHNPTVADDHVHSTLFDMEWTIDDLNRVIQAERGQWGGSSISTLAEDELWTLTTVGGWDLHKLDIDGDGSFTGTGDLQVSGTLNLANELTARDEDDTPGTTGDNYTLTYTDRGDLKDDGKAYKYTYDAFGRLRKIHNQSNALVAEYRYNGLGQLIAIHYDNANPVGVDGSDAWLHLVYDDQWRVVAEHWDSETKPDAIYVHHAGGVAGSGSYIDELAFRERDVDNDASKVLEERRFYAQNWRKDVVAMLDSSGGLVEQVRYSSYGVSYGLPAGDTDSDGDYDATDLAAITGSYDVRKDANLDGSIDIFDVLHAASVGGGGYVTTGRDVLGNSHNENRFGYGAYLRDPAVSQLHVRHRVFRSDIGRWLTRDPAGYVDGLNLYEYVMARSVKYLDPSGLDMGPGGIWIYPEVKPDLRGATPGNGVSRKIVQATLDAIGCVEPTPFCDLTNAGIHIAHGEYAAAGFSCCGVVPYAGDTFKVAGKYGYKAWKFFRQRLRAPQPTSPNRIISPAPPPTGTANRPWRQQYNPEADGSHCTLLRQGGDGPVKKYQEWDLKPDRHPLDPHPFAPGRRYDQNGPPHRGVPTPHVKDPDGTIRPPEPWEIPAGW